MRRLAVILALSSLASCTDKAAPPPKREAAQSAPLGPGEERLAVNDGTIWFKKSGNGSGVPLIMLHGGPGVSSYYLKPLEALGDDRPIIRYDQLGSGKSGPLTDTTKFRIERFVA